MQQLAPETIRRRGELLVGHGATIGHSCRPDPRSSGALPWVLVGSASAGRGRGVRPGVTGIVGGGSLIALVVGLPALIEPLVAEVAAVPVAAITEPAFVAALLPTLHVVAARVVGAALPFLYHTPARGRGLRTSCLAPVRCERYRPHCPSGLRVSPASASAGRRGR